MKKKFLIIFVNVIFLALIYFVADFCAMYNFYKNQDWFTKRPLQEKFNVYKYQYRTKSNNELNNIYIYDTNKEMRPIENKNSKKKPIVIFGCSYAYGANLKENETFSSQLGKYLSNPIYNRALSARSVQHMLYQLKNEDLYKIIPEPESIIYMYIFDQIPRCILEHSPITSDFSYVVNKNGNLEILHKTYYHSDLLSTINYRIVYKNRDKYTKKHKDFFKLHLIESKKEAEKHWKNNFKFYIFVYEPKLTWFEFEMLEELRAEGFTVIYLHDLKKNTNFQETKYTISETDKHPNARAWKEITPLFVKKFNNHKKNVKSAWNSYPEIYIYNNVLNDIELAMNPTKNINSNYKPIVIFGGSSAKGKILKRNQTFSSSLSKLIPNKIVDRSLSNTGIQHMLYQLSNEDFYKIVQKPEAIVYVSTYYDRKRLYYNEAIDSIIYYADIFYKKDGENLIFTPASITSNHILHNLKLQLFDLYVKTPHFQKKSIEELKLYYEKSKEISEKHWGKDVKFIILRVDNCIKPLYNKMFKELEAEGFIVIRMSDLSKKNLNTQPYWVSEKNKHPNAKAWKEITPLFVEKSGIGR